MLGYLKDPVCSNGQLWFAIVRARNSNYIDILIKETASQTQFWMISEKLRGILSILKLSRKK
jgi:hypothetical protein